MSLTMSPTRPARVTAPSTWPRRLSARVARRLGRFRRRRIAGRLLPLLLALLLPLVLAPMAQACPLCSEALANQSDPSAGNVAAGYSASILFMIAAPFLLFGGFAGMLYWVARRHGAGAESDLPGEPWPG